MAEKTTIARPYAHAMFEVARSKGDLGKVSEALAIAAAVAKDEAFASLIGAPNVSSEKLADLVISICDKKATPEVGNFLKLLAENDRLEVLPEISELFEEYKALEESTIEAEVVSARKLTAAQQKEIVSKLKARLGREVTLHNTIDESIIGGAIIRAGDLVIDGSITAQLEKLAVALSR